MISPEISRLMESAKERSRGGDLKGALELLERVVAAEPGNPEALFEMGVVRYREHRYGDAEALFRTLLPGGTGNDEAAVLLAKTFREAGKPAEAYSFFKDSVRRGDLPSKAAVVLAESLKDAGMFDESCALFEYIRAKEPDDPGPALMAAHLNNYLGRFDAAQKALKPWMGKETPLGRLDRNRVLNEWEIATKQTVLDSKPRILLVTLSTKCNLRCPMCGRSHKEWDMPDRMRDEVLSLLPTLELVTWQGGEVFLYPHFKALLEEARKNTELKQIIITNGLLITGEWAELLAAQPNLDLTVSVDSVDPRTYAAIRPGGDLTTVRKSLALLKDLNRRQGSRMTVAIRGTVMRSNYRELEDLLEFAREYDCKVLQLMPLNGNWNNENIFEPRDDKAMAHIEAARAAVRRKAETYGIRLLDWLPPTGGASSGGEVRSKPSLTPPHHSPIICFRPWRQIAINVEGVILPECLCRRALGTVRDGGIAAAWNNPIMQAYRSGLIAARHEMCNPGCLRGDIPPEHLRFICQ